MSPVSMAAGDVALDAQGRVILGEGQVLLDCCCEEPGNPCANCTGSTARYATVTLAGITLADIICGSTCHKTNRNNVNGVYCLRQSANACVWTCKQLRPIRYRASTACAVPTGSPDYVVVTLTRLSGGNWQLLARVERFGNPAQTANIFSATFSAGASCTFGPIVVANSKTTTSCGAPPDIGFGGTATIVTGQCEACNECGPCEDTTQVPFEWDITISGWSECTGCRGAGTSMKWVSGTIDGTYRVPFFSWHSSGGGSCLWSYVVESDVIWEDCSTHEQGNEITVTFGFIASEPSPWQVQIHPAHGFPASLELLSSADDDAIDCVNGSVALSSYIPNCSSFFGHVLGRGASAVAVPVPA